jgi:hypothetical protein
MLGQIGRRSYIIILGICIYLVIYPTILIKYVLLKNVIKKAICGSYSTYALKAYCTLTQTEFLHSYPEALHTPSGVRDLC